MEIEFKRNSNSNNSNKSKINRINYDYSKMNNMLGMFTTPYLGVYGHEYSFFTPIKTFHKQNPSGSFLETLPEKLQKNLIDFRNRFSVETDYFDIALDASFILNKFHKTNITHHLRVNCVLHPYLFYNVGSLASKSEHKTFVFCALFSDENSLDLNSLYIEDTKENDGLRINPEFIFHDENKKEVILHDSGEGFPALSPNNMGFLMDLKNGFFSFYLLAVLTYGHKVVRLLITRFVVVMNTEVPIFKGFYKAFNSMHKTEYSYEKPNFKSLYIIDANSNSNNSNINKLSDSDIQHYDINILDNADNEPVSTPEVTNSSSNSNKPKKNIENSNSNIRYSDINFFNAGKKKFDRFSSEAIKYDLTSIDGFESKIKLENFLSELFYFENLFKLVINFIRGFLIAKIHEVFSALGTKSELIKSDSITSFVLDFIKTCFETLHLDENFELLNKNSQYNFYDLITEEEDEVNSKAFSHENINSIPNSNNSDNNNHADKSFFNHENKINDYYPYKNFEKKFDNILHIGKNDKRDSNHQLIGEYGLFRFYSSINLLFKNPNIDKFGNKLFIDYLNYGKEKRNYAFLKFIDNFFLLELNKVVNICNKYRVFLNEFELNVPLSELQEKSTIRVSKAAENFEITKSECKFSPKFLNFFSINFAVNK